LKYNQNIYKGTPYEHDIGGTNSVIKTFNLKKTKYFLQQILCSCKIIVVSVAGKVPKNIDKIIAKYFGGKLRGSNSKTPEYKPIENFMEKQKKPRFFSMVDNVDQAEVIVGFPCFNYNERKTHVLKIISIVLAGNMSSRFVC